jgi:hypothetical protein
MQELEITAERPTTGAAVTVKVPIGDNLDELKTQFGDDAVYTRARQSLIIAIQAFLRLQLDANKPQEEIQQLALEWKPGQRRPAKTPEDAARDALGKMSAEQRAAFIKELKARAA